MTAFIHAGISVTDLEGSIEWYTRFFDMCCIRRFEKPGLRIQAAVCEVGDVQIEMIQPHTPVAGPAREKDLAATLQHLGCNHLALGVEDARACYRKLEEAGTFCITGLMDERMFFCADPDGTVLEVKQCEY